MNKEEYITKEYFDKTLDKKLENFVTKDYLDKTLDKRFSSFEKRMDFKMESLFVRFEQHTTDLTSGYNEKMRGVGNQVQALDDKITRVDQKVTSIEHKVDSLTIDVFNIKETLKERTDKKDTLKLKKRIIKLELREKAVVDSN